MGMTEKQTLIDSITLKLLEDYNLPIKEIKSKITEILQNYHITISDERFCGENLSTEYLLSKFKEGKKAIGMSDKTLNQYEIAINKLEEITNKRLADIEVDDVNNFLMIYGKTVSSVTLRAKYQLLSSVYNYLFQRKYINHNPILYINAPKSTTVCKTILNDYDLEKLKNVCENMNGIERERDIAIIYTFISTGCRVSELCNIKIKDVDFTNKTIKVLGKGNKERFVALNDKSIYRIKLYLSQRKNINLESPLFSKLRGVENPLSKDGMENIIKKIRIKANVDYVTCHTFRRYFSTELRKKGVNIQVIAKSLGHSNLNQINRYSLYDNGEVVDIIKQVI